MRILSSSIYALITCISTATSLIMLLAAVTTRARYIVVGGLFTVQREIIKNGIRISLLNCPNALAFTITKEEQGVVLHCTINSAEPDQDFVESIELFLSDLRNGIAQI